MNVEGHDGESFWILTDCKELPFLSVETLGLHII